MAVQALKTVGRSLALGCMRMASLNTDEAEKIILKAMEYGIILFDHADIYGGGKSEELFGQVLKLHPEIRDTILLQDKCGIRDGWYDLSAEHIIEAVEGSLRRLGTDRLDRLLLHRPDALMEPEEIAFAFDRLKSDGKVLSFGVSNMNSDQIRLLQAYLPENTLQADQMQFGLGHCSLAAEGINVNTDFPQAIDRSGGLLDFCRLHHIEVQAWSPLQYGMFAGTIFSGKEYGPLTEELTQIGKAYGCTPAAVALAWILRHPAGIRIILGTMSVRHLAESCEAVKITLTRKEWYRLYQIAGNPLP